eukprot:TRINITY_DN8299_c0_g1_i1.p1 TRINITY_DN8299_c0_g1~~TRINITY_DN8299_c0_g1_i1.p1  ORF type:complete len:1161 (-),score=257.62 TRINITY_DN8299_c0_g1_i1:2036-5518(-)
MATPGEQRKGVAPSRTDTEPSGTGLPDVANIDAVVVAVLEQLMHSKSVFSHNVIKRAYIRVCDKYDRYYFRQTIAALLAKGYIVPEGPAGTRQYRIDAAHIFGAATSTGTPTPAQSSMQESPTWKDGIELPGLRTDPVGMESLGAVVSRNLGATTTASVSPGGAVPGPTASVTGDETLRRAQELEAQRRHDIAVAKQLVKERARVEHDKGGVVVTPIKEQCLVAPKARELEDGKTCVYLITLRAENRGTTPVPIKGVDVIYPSKYCDAIFDVDTVPPNVVLAPSNAFEVDLRLVCEKDKVHHVRCFAVINFGSFHIGRFFSWTTGLNSQPGLADLMPHEQYVKPARSKRGEGDVLKGQVVSVGDRPERKSTQSKYVLTRLPDYPLPKSKEAYQKLLADAHLPISLSSYADKFRALVFLEEQAGLDQMKSYDQLDTNFCRTTSRLLWLKVPGLSEKRPSVMVGDQIRITLVSEARKKQDQAHIGIVHEITRDEVGIAFHAALHSKFIGNLARERINVRFIASRLVYRQRHHSLKQIAQHRGVLDRVMRPSKVGVESGCDEGISVINYLENPLNNEQQLACRIIMSMTGPAARGVRNNTDGTATAPPAAQRVAPFILFGPPGTGKTTTLVQTTLNILRTQPQARILITAPSNAAVDNFAERILAALDNSDKALPITRQSILRIQAYGRTGHPGISEGIKAISYRDKNDGSYSFPPLDIVNKARVIFTTCTMASCLPRVGLSADFFSYVIIDEAGQADEPEAMCSLIGNVGRRTQIVLGGDPKQLGPVCLSLPASDLGLSTSMLERMMQLPLYQATRVAGAGDAVSTPTSKAAYERAKRKGIPRQRAGFDPLFVTQLTQNYRSHSAILSVPSRLFYNNTLTSRAESDAVSRWQGLPNPDYPIWFQSVQGHETREKGSPSWFNVVEVEAVKKVVQDLMTDKNIQPPVQESDFAIICPYRRQVLKVRQYLKRNGYNNINIGSVELLQGQEARIVIISTVRSSTEHDDADAKHHLGFLANPKRFNVSVTRARALLVVVGSATVLRFDPNWKTLIDECELNGALTGHRAFLTSAPATPVTGSHRGFDKIDLASTLAQVAAAQQVAGGHVGEAAGLGNVPRTSVSAKVWANCDVDVVADDDDDDDDDDAGASDGSFEMVDADICITGE